MNKRTFIDRQILGEIRRKKEKMNDCEHCIIQNVLRRHAERGIDKEATLHSYRIEHDSEFFKTDYDTHASRRSIRKGSKAIANAISWGVKEFDVNKFDENFVQELAAKAVPDVFVNGYGFYRNSGVRVSGADWTPPYAEKIPREMERFVQYIKANFDERSLSSVIETAIYAHLQLVRIHPFSDGNGRTSRSLQNVILQANGLPHPVIYAGERHDYYHHLQEAINGWRNRTSDSESENQDSPKETAFYNYIAGKISASFDRILETR